MQAKNESRPFWLTVIVFTFLFSLYAALHTYARAGEAGIVLPRSIWGGMLLVYSVTAIACIWLFVGVARSRELPFHLSSFGKNIRLDRPAWRAAGWIVFVVILILIPYLKFYFQIGQNVKKPIFAFDPGMLIFLFYWVCWWLILLAMTALKVALNTTWQTRPAK